MLKVVLIGGRPVTGFCYGGKSFLCGSNSGNEYCSQCSVTYTLFKKTINIGTYFSLFFRWLFSIKH